MKINEPVIHADKHYPAEASAGRDNAYYLHGCEVVERSPSYASCLYKLAEQDAGRVHELHGECSKAHPGRCQARAMREQEKLAGVALFYFPRKSPQALTLPVKVTGEFGVQITNLTDPALIPKDPKSLRDRFSTPPARGTMMVATSESETTVDPLQAVLDDAQTGMAQAITEAVKEPAKVPEVKSPEPAPKAVVSPVEQAAKPTRPPMNPGETPLQYARRIAALKNPT